MLSDAYVAGLFDGEGTVSIKRASGHYYGAHGYSYQLVAVITLRQESLLLQLQTEYGGACNRRTQATEVHAAYYYWQVTGEAAKSFCTRMIPHLQIKRTAAQLAVEFQTFKAENKNQPNSLERVDRLTQFFDAMRTITAKGPHAIEVLIEEEVL